MSIYNAPVGIIAGLGLLMILPGQARADRDGISYGNAEITLGFPHGQVTVGRTWGDEPRQVVVEDRDRYDDEDERDHVVIERRGEHHRHRVMVIERYEEPVRCDREEEVVRRVYVQPPCDRPEVVVYRQPERVVYAPSRIVYAPSRQVEHVIVTPGYGPGGHIQDRPSSDSRPRDLFPEDSGRPTRMRGVQHQVAQAGGFPH
jgi:hypothetical protein